MSETIPWNWQDTATLIGCAAMLILAFWISRRIKGKGGGGCHRGEDASKTVVPLTSLSIGRRPAPSGSDRPGGKGGNRR